jgi:ribosomal protein S27E
VSRTENFPMRGSGMTNDDQIVTAQQLGVVKCPVCGSSRGFISFGTGGELDELFVFTKSQLDAQSWAEEAGAEIAYAGKGAFAVTCGACGFLMLWDAAKIREEVARRA